MRAETIEFHTAAQLVAAIQKLAGGILSLDQVYLKSNEGEEFGALSLEQETLSDGSVAFNLILEQVVDRDR